METASRHPRRRSRARRPSPPPAAEAAWKIVSVRVKRADGTPAFGVFTVADAARRLGLPASLSPGDEAAPGVTFLLRDDGVELRVAATELKEGYRVANDWAIAIREVASIPVRIQTLAREDSGAPAEPA